MEDKLFAPPKEARATIRGKPGQCHICDAVSDDLQPLYIRVSRSNSAIGTVQQVTVFVEVLGCPSCQTKVSVLDKLKWVFLSVLAAGIPFVFGGGWVLDRIGLDSLVWIVFALPVVLLVSTGVAFLLKHRLAPRQERQWEYFWQ